MISSAKALPLGHLFPALLQPQPSSIKPAYKTSWSRNSRLTLKYKQYWCLTASFAMYSIGSLSSDEITTALAKLSVPPPKSWRSENYTHSREFPWCWVGKIYRGLFSLQQGRKECQVSVSWKKMMMLIFSYYFHCLKFSWCQWLQYMLWSLASAVRPLLLHGYNLQ